MVSALVFVGCDFSRNEASQPFENPYAEVGKVHNQAIDNALADLKAVQTPVKNRGALFDTAETSVRAFFEEKGAGKGTLKDIEWGARLARSARQARIGTQSAFPASASAKTGMSMLPDSVLARLTPGQEQYIKEMMGLLGSGLSTPAFEEQLVALNKAAVEDLGEEEAQAVLYVSAVAKSSVNYWRENYGEWMEASLSLAARTDSVDIEYRGTVDPDIASTSTQGDRPGGATASTRGDDCYVAYTYESGGTTVIVVKCMESPSEEGSSPGNSGGGDNGNCTELEGCGGFLGSADDIARADLAGAAAGAVFGAGAGAGMLSTEQGVEEFYDWMEEDESDDW